MDAAKRQALLFLLIAATAILPAAAWAADAFPNRPIRLVVPYPPGGGTDIVARVLGEKLGASLGQPIVVDNRGGAGGVLGTEIAAKAAPDGYTLLLVPSSHVINPSIYAKLPYDTVADFAPIAMVASAAILMAVNPHVPADTVRGFVEAAKARQLRLGRRRHGFSPHRAVVQSALGIVAATCALSRRRTDGDCAVGGRGSARVRNYFVVTVACPSRHATRTCHHKRAAQHHDA